MNLPFSSFPPLPSVLLSGLDLDVRMFLLALGTASLDDYVNFKGVFGGRGVFNRDFILQWWDPGPTVRPCAPSWCSRVPCSRHNDLLEVVLPKVGDLSVVFTYVAGVVPAPRLACWVMCRFTFLLMETQLLPVVPLRPASRTQYKFVWLCQSACATPGSVGEHHSTNVLLPAAVLCRPVCLCLAAWATPDSVGEPACPGTPNSLINFTFSNVRMSIT